MKPLSFIDVGWKTKSPVWENVKAQTERELCLAIAAKISKVHSSIPRTIGDGYEIV